MPRDTRAAARPRSYAARALSWLLIPQSGQLFLAVLAIGIFWRVWRYLMPIPYWGDEGFVGVNFLRRDFTGMIDPLLYGQIVPLFFMWVELAVFRVLGHHEYALRLVPMLAGVAGLLVYARFLTNVLPRRAHVLALAFLSFSYYTVRHGAELKPYTVDLLVSVLLTALAWRVMQPGRSRAAWAGLIALAAIAPWSSYPSIYVSSSVAIVQLWNRWTTRRPAEWVAPLAFGLILVASFGWMYFAFAKPHAEAASALTTIPMWKKAFLPTEGSWWELAFEIPLWLVGVHTGLLFAHPHGGVAPGSIVTALLFVVGAAWMWRRDRRLLALLLLPFALGIAASSLKVYPYGTSVRTSIFLAPAICLLAGAGLYVALRGLYSTLTRTVRRARGAAPARNLLMRSWVHMLESLAPVLCFRAGRTLVLVVLGFIPLVSMIGEAIFPQQSPFSRASREAVLDLIRQTRANDVWITFNADRRVSYAAYLGDGVGGSQWVFDVARLAPVRLHWAPEPERVTVLEGGTLWLMAYRGYKLKLPEELLEAYVDRLEVRFGGAEFRRYLLKSGIDKNGQPEIEALDVFRFDAGR